MEKLDTNKDYIKIAPNLYKFIESNVNLNLDLDLEKDIYILYNNGCKIKKENKIKALNIFKRCKELINPDIKEKIVYEIYINLALLVSELNGSSEEIGKYYEESMKIYSDRAEPYYYWGLYCNQHRNFEKSYTLLKKAILITYKDAIIKYPETHYNVYGKYLYDELSVACYWLKKYDEAKNLLEKIIDDPDFANSRERLQKNLDYTLKELEIN